MNAPIIIYSIFLYFTVGVYIACLAGEFDGDRLIAYAIFWPLIVFLFLLAVTRALIKVAVEALYKIILKK